MQMNVFSIYVKYWFHVNLMNDFSQSPWTSQTWSVRKRQVSLYLKITHRLWPILSLLSVHFVSHFQTAIRFAIKIVHDFSEITEMSPSIFKEFSHFIIHFFIYVLFLHTFLFSIQTFFYFLYILTCNLQYFPSFQMWNKTVSSVS